MYEVQHDDGKIETMTKAQLKEAGYSSQPASNAEIMDCNYAISMLSYADRRQSRLGNYVEAL